jgi:hypothetical protein
MYIFSIASSIKKDEKNRVCISSFRSWKIRISLTFVSLLDIFYTTQYIPFNNNLYGGCYDIRILKKIAQKILFNYAILSRKLLHLFHHFRFKSFFERANGQLNCRICTTYNLHGQYASIFCSI